MGQIKERLALILKIATDFRARCTDTYIVLRTGWKVADEIEDAKQTTKCRSRG